MIRFAARGAGLNAFASATVPEGRTLIQPQRLAEHWDRLADLQRKAQTMLAGLDELGLHQAAAYVSMALDIMRRERPDLLTTG